MRLNYVSLLLCFLLKILAKSTTWTDPTRVDKEVHKVADTIRVNYLTSPQSGRTL